MYYRLEVVHKKRDQGSFCPRNWKKSWLTEMRTMSRWSLGQRIKSSILDTLSSRLLLDTTRYQVGNWKATRLKIHVGESYACRWYINLWDSVRLPKELVQIKKQRSNNCTRGIPKLNGKGRRGFYGTHCYITFYIFLSSPIRQDLYLVRWYLHNTQTNTWHI